jgi:hypothetical protein
MKSTRSRFVAVAAVVCLFATGMATFLNYYKYKSTLGEIVATRMLVIGLSIENSIQSSLALGLNFNELATLPALMERERLADKLIAGIDVFDAQGKVLYSTDAPRVGSKVPAAWASAAAAPNKDNEWQVAEPDQLVAGIALQNNFNLTVGYLAMRYAREYVDSNVREMGMHLLAVGAAVFAAAVALVSLLLTAFLRRYERDMRAIEARLAGSGEAAAVPAAFAPALEELREAMGDAEAGLAQVRAGLKSGGSAADGVRS